jgi:hypothetical protein
MAGKPRKSAGTYGFTDLLRLTMRNPRLLLAALLTDGTTDQENAADSTAVQDGETRRVSCWLRGSSAPAARIAASGTSGGPKFPWSSPASCIRKGTGRKPTSSCLPRTPGWSPDT